MITGTLRKLVRRQILLLSFLILIGSAVALVGLSESFTYYAQMVQTNEDRKKDLKWASIESTINTYNKHSRIVGSRIKVNIINAVNEKYKDRAILAQDLLKPSENAHLYTIMSNEIRDQYNQPDQESSFDYYVASRQGVIAHWKQVTFKNKEMGAIPWGEISKGQFNNFLLDASIKSLLEQKRVVLISEPEDLIKDPNHRIITTPGKDQLKKVFMEEGLAGLKSYRIIVPVYIEEQEDILGVPDVTALGDMTDNNKLYVLVSYNLYEAVLSSQGSMLDDIDKSTLSLSNIIASQKLVLGGTILGILLMLCIGVVMGVSFFNAIPSSEVVTTRHVEIAEVEVVTEEEDKGSNL